MTLFLPILRQLTPQAMTRSLFVKNARSLEKLKTVGVTDEVFRNGKYLVFLKEGVLIDSNTKKLSWQTTESLPESSSDENLKILLDVVGQDPEIGLFAVNLPVTSSEEEIGRTLGGTFYNARKALFVLNDRESSLVSQARGLINYCQTTNFCKSCGGKLVLKPTGTLKTCPDCNKVHYPSLAPVGIVLIDNAEHSRVLLVRGARHPEGMYSCVAGFIEPGESLEGNIRREIAEEVGLDVENIQYCSSQHWAMPESQLMMGCLATATSDDFELDPVELQDGKWFDADTLADAVTRAKTATSIPDPTLLWVPPPTAVAHTLMEHWLKLYHGFVPKTTSHF